MQGKWIELKVVTKSAAVEPVSGIFYGLDVKGVAIEDPEDLKKKTPVDWDYADASIFEYGNTAAVVKGYFSKTDDIDNIEKYVKGKLAELKNMGIDTGESKVIVKEVKEEDWATSWKKYYKTTKIGKRVVVKPTWESYTPLENEIVIEMDPGMAFGTGTHETTSMCIRMLEDCIKGNETVFDIGTGSGILSIAASYLGAGKVVGVDIDEVAVDSAKKNVACNNLKNVEIHKGDLVDVVSGKADIIVANIIAEVIIKLTGIVKPFMKQGSIFITSGIIKEKKDEVIKALTNSNFKIEDVQEMGEWVAIASINTKGDKNA